MPHHSKDGPSAARHPNHARRAELGVAALAFELRQSGIVERGLGFALRTLGADLVLEDLRRSERFGRRARRRAALSVDRDERAAWTILAASGPRAIERRLERDGLARRRPRRDRRVRSGARGGPGGGRPAAGAEPNVVLLHGRASFGSRASRSPFQEQLAEVALALAEAV
jgi:hypothetical protein